MDNQTNHEIEPEDRAIAERLTLALRTEVPPEIAACHEALLRARVSGAGVTQLVRRRRRRVAAVAVAAVLTIGAPSMAVASSGTVPGDILYPVNRGLERAQLVLARSPDARADKHLALAAKRLEEIDAIRERGTVEHLPRLIADLADSIDATFQAVGDADPETREDLRVHVTSRVMLHVERLEGVRAALAESGLVPQQTLDAVDMAIRQGREAVSRAGAGLDRRPATPGRPENPGDSNEAPGPPTSPGPPAGSPGYQGPGQQPDQGQGQDQQPGQGQSHGQSQQTGSEAGEQGRQRAPAEPDAGPPATPPAGRP